LINFNHKMSKRILYVCIKNSVGDLIYDVIILCFVFFVFEAAIWV